MIDKTLTQLIFGLMAMLILAAIIGYSAAKIKPKKTKLKKYYPVCPANGGGSFEPCQVKKDGTRMCSMFCCRCDFNLGRGRDKKGKWIKCAKINEATGVLI